MSEKKQIIIIGGGQAAAYAAKEIRAIDTSSEVIIITDEENFPYERPPLSKDCILGKMTIDQCLFFPESFYIENKIKVVFDTKVNEINFNTKQIFCSKKKIFYYDKLLLATGAANRKLKLNDEDIIPNENLIYLRNAKESESIKKKIETSEDILIIGGGFIGLEIASSASQLGKNITILERGNQLMGRVIPKQIAKLIQDRHEEGGAKIYLSVEIKKIDKVGNTYEVF